MHWAGGDLWRAKHLSPHAGGGKVSKRVIAAVGLMHVHQREWCIPCDASLPAVCVTETGWLMVDPMNHKGCALRPHALPSLGRERVVWARRRCEPARLITTAVHWMSRGMTRWSVCVRPAHGPLPMMQSGGSPCHHPWKHGDVWCIQGFCPWADVCVPVGNDRAAHEANGCLAGSDLMHME